MVLRGERNWRKHDLSLATTSLSHANAGNRTRATAVTSEGFIALCYPDPAEDLFGLMLRNMVKRKMGVGENIPIGAVVNSLFGTILSDIQLNWFRCHHTDM